MPGRRNGNGSAQATDATISGNSAGDQGGGAYIAYWGSLALTDATVRGNGAELYGGGIYSDGLLTFDGSILTNNTAGLYGGGYYWVNAPATILGGAPSITGSEPDDVYPTP